MILYDWGIYYLLFKERFEEVLDNLITEFKELRETERIGEYYAKFEVIRSRLRMFKEYLVRVYLVGLRMDI